MQPPRAPGSREATEDIVRHLAEAGRLDKEPAKNRGVLNGVMPQQLAQCEYREATAPGTVNRCRAGLYGGLVTDGACRLCLSRGDKPVRVVVLPRIPLGDVVARCLRLAGITPEAFAQLTNSPECGCKRRQSAMNEWGYRQTDRLEQLLRRLAAWYRLD